MTVCGVQFIDGLLVVKCPVLGHCSGQLDGTEEFIFMVDELVSVVILQLDAACCCNIACHIL